MTDNRPDQFPEDSPELIADFEALPGGPHSDHRMADILLGRLDRVDRTLQKLEVYFYREKERLQKEHDYYMRSLKVVGERMREADGKATHYVPHGMVKVTASPGRTVIVDESAAKDWARLRLPSKGAEQIIKIKETLDKRALKNALDANCDQKDDGTYIDPATGEEIPFARVEGKGELSVSYKAGEEGQA